MLELGFHEARHWYERNPNSFGREINDILFEKDEVDC